VFLFSILASKKMLCIYLQLKKGLLTEVRSEAVITEQNTKMLELQLQAKENEVRRLRMELLLQSVNTGTSRRKQVIESDVWAVKKIVPNICDLFDSSTCALNLQVALKPCFEMELWQFVPKWWQGLLRDFW